MHCLLQRIFRVSCVFQNCCSVNVKKTFTGRGGGGGGGGWGEGVGMLLVPQPEPILDHCSQK